MHDADLITQLRHALRPQGDSDIVHIGFLDSSYNGTHFHGEFIERAIDTLEKRIMVASIALEPLNELEILATQLLLSSAYITKEK